MKLRHRTTRHQRMKRKLRSSYRAGRRRKVRQNAANYALRQLIAIWRSDPRWAPPLGTASEPDRMRYWLPGQLINDPDDLLKVTGI